MEWIPKQSESCCSLLLAFTDYSLIEEELVPLWFCEEREREGEKECTPCTATTRKSRENARVHKFSV